MPGPCFPESFPVLGRIFVRGVVPYQGLFPEPGRRLESTILVEQNIDFPAAPVAHAVLHSIETHSRLKTDLGFDTIASETPGKVSCPGAR
jgi:hypothetical protein